MVDPAKVCRTITLTDEPEENDAFSGPHQRIADAIAGLIEPTDAKGISIGVEGSWGSGKSTVARLLTKRLEANNDIATVYFDAWAHEGDPLRRTFLETIIRKLQSRGWITEKRWEDIIEELANRREVVETKDSLKITKSGRLIAFTLLLIPIGSSFITAALRESNITLYPGPPAWKFLILFLIGLLLIFTPFIVLLLKIKEEADLLSLLFNKGPTEKTTVTSKTVNPTSIEFEETFNKLLDSALGKNQKRLVLILDNLDRVDAKDALSIWSTLQTFLQHKGMSPRSWHERLWLLVLYDIRGLSLLWENSENSSGRTALSFIDKSFQVRFEVPALVLSDWRTLLTDFLTDAFPNHSVSDRHDVYRVLATNVAQNTKALTIRELKLFVNQIGAVHRQWAGSDPSTDSFPLALIAYYVLLRREHENVLHFLMDEEFPPNEYLDLVGSDIRESLAAIAFNVEVGAARQLLFAGRIKNALTLGDPEELKKVASLLSKGFWDVFEQIAKDWVAGESVKVADAALALEESGVAKDAYGPSLHSVIRAIANGASSVSAWAPLTERRAKGLAVIFKWKKDIDPSQERIDDFIQARFRTIALGLKEHAKESVDQLVAAKEWLSCLSITVRELESTTNQLALTTVVETLSRQLTSGTLNALEFELCTHVLLQLEKESEINSTVTGNLKALVDTGKIGESFLSNETKSASQFAVMVYVLIRYSSALKKLPSHEQSVAARERELKNKFSAPMVEAFVELLREYKQIPLLFTSLKNSLDIKLLGAESLKIILRDLEAKDLFLGEEAIERLEFVFAELGKNEEEIATLTRLLLEVQKEVNVLRGLRARNFNPRVAKLYLSVLQSTPDQKEFASWCARQLGDLSESDWRPNFYTISPEGWEHVRMRGPLLELAFYLHRLGVEIELGQEYAIVLSKLLSPPSDLGWPVRPNEDENPAALLGPIGSEARESFLGVLEKFVKSRNELPKWFLGNFGPEVIAQLHHSPRGVHLLELIFAHQDETPLAWLSTMLAENLPSLQKKYQQDPGWLRFKSTLRDAVIKTSSGSDIYPHLKKIADIFNVSLPQTLKRKLRRNGVIAFAIPNDPKLYSVNSKDKTRAVLFEISSPFVPSQLNWAPDGRKLAYVYCNHPLGWTYVCVFDFQSSENMKVSDRGSQPSWSPDGKALVFVGETPSDKNIFTVDLLSREEQKLTNESGIYGHPTWSPDGSKIVFHHGDQTDRSRIWIMDADGSNRRAITSGVTDVDPSWSNDGATIIFARRQPQRVSGIYQIRLNGDDVKILLPFPDPFAPTWSPDGSKILFQAGLGSDARIYQMEADGHNKELLTAGIDPSWRPLLNDSADETPKSPSAPSNSKQ